MLASNQRRRKQLRLSEKLVASSRTDRSSHNNSIIHIRVNIRATAPKHRQLSLVRQQQQQRQQQQATLDTNFNNSELPSSSVAPSPSLSITTSDENFASTATDVNSVEVSELQKDSPTRSNLSDGTNTADYKTNSGTINRLNSEGLISKNQLTTEFESHCHSCPSEGECTGESGYSEFLCRTQDKLTTNGKDAGSTISFISNRKLQNQQPRSAESSKTSTSDISRPTAEVHIANEKSDEKQEWKLSFESSEQDKTLLIDPPVRKLDKVDEIVVDFVRSRQAVEMRDLFDGWIRPDYTGLEELQQIGGYDHDDYFGVEVVTSEITKATKIVGHLEIQSAIVSKEFLLPLHDVAVSLFLKDPGMFRAVGYRTRCMVEVTRRVLNRKLCINGRWFKYLVIRVIGPSLKMIDCCDRLLRKSVPAYRTREPYISRASCSMYIDESMPDNTKLYFNYQRTGATCSSYGQLALNSPYRSTDRRPLTSTPWKMENNQRGHFYTGNHETQLCMEHIYPGYGFQRAAAINPKIMGQFAVVESRRMQRQAAELAQIEKDELYKQRIHVTRH